MNPLLLDLPEELNSERLLLRVPRAGDGAVINASIRESLDELKPWMPWAREVPPLEDTEAFVRRAHFGFIAREVVPYALFCTKTKEHVGIIDLHNAKWKVPKFEIGYWLRTKYVGNGYMTEAVNCLTTFAFEKLGAVRVTIRADERNEPSWRVAVRAGYILEGLHRSEELDNEGKPCNMRCYAKIRSDYLKP